MAASIEFAPESRSSSSPIPNPQSLIPPRWSTFKLLAFRFAFTYLVVYSFPFPLDSIPWLGEQIYRPWNAIWIGLAKRLLGADIDVQPTGSGDMAWNYVQFAAMLVIAAAVTIIWSIVDRGRANYVRLYRYLHMYVRFVLATAMFSYGISKVIPTQFPPPTLDRLVQSYGSSSPMGLVWTFMGASTAYVIFTGAAETLAAVLLIARRTALLGALVAIGVMANVVALNFCYDVPVKLYSTHLLLMAVFIAAPDARKLLDLFVLRAPEPLFRTRALHIASLVLRTLFVAFILYSTITQSIGYYHQIHDTSKRSPLRGIWRFDVFEENGVARPPLLTDATRWRRMVFGLSGASIYLMNDDRLRYGAKLDEKTKSILFTNRFEKKTPFTLTYSRPNARTLQLDGTVEGKKIHAVCTLEEKSFLLTDRGFHWINERPYNR
jgi:hypothetical protein